MNSPKDLIIAKYHPWPLACIDHFFADGQLTRGVYVIILVSRGFTVVNARLRADAVEKNPQQFLVRGGE